MQAARSCAVPNCVQFRSCNGASASQARHSSATPDHVSPRAGRAPGRDWATATGLHKALAASCSAAAAWLGAFGGLGTPATWALRLRNGAESGQEILHLSLRSGRPGGEGHRGA